MYQHIYSLRISLSIKYIWIGLCALVNLGCWGRLVDCKQGFICSFRWLTAAAPYLMTAGPYLMTAAPYLMTAAPYLMTAAPYLMTAGPYLMVNSYRSILCDLSPASEGHPLQLAIMMVGCEKGMV